MDIGFGNIVQNKIAARNLNKMIFMDDVLGRFCLVSLFDPIQFWFVSGANKLHRNVFRGSQIVSKANTII